MRSSRGRARSRSRSGPRGERAPPDFVHPVVHLPERALGGRRLGRLGGALGIGWMSRSGKWRKANSSLPAIWSRIRRTIGYAAVQYGHWKSPYIDQLELGPLGTVDVVLGGEWGRQFASWGGVDRRLAAVNDIEILIVLVAAAIVLVRLADAISIPYPIVLVLGGLANRLHPRRPDPRAASPRSSSWSSCRRCCSPRGTGPRPGSFAPSSCRSPGSCSGLTLATMVRGRGGRRRRSSPASTGPRPSCWERSSPRRTPSRRSPPSSGSESRTGVATLVEGESMVNDAVALVSLQGGPRRRRERDAHRGEAILDDLVLG